MRLLKLFFLALATTASAAETVLPLWPEGVPGKRVAPSKSVLERIGPKGNQPGRETFIDEPSITVYPAAKPNGAAVIVCPGGGMDGDHPTTWCHEVGKGRAWYTGGGHTKESFAEPLFRSHLKGGVEWAGRRAGSSDVTKPAPPR